jgi:hypothetical protein
MAEKTGDSEAGHQQNTKQKEIQIHMEMNEQSLSNREQWEFTFTAREVVVALDKRIEHHTSRLAWWENEMDQAEAGLVDKGFEYRERHQTGYAELVVVGDPELANRVKQCRGSVNRHKEKKQFLETWNRVLGSRLKQDSEATLLMKYDDVKFFGL